MEGLMSGNDIYDGNTLWFDNYVCNLHFLGGVLLSVFLKNDGLIEIGMHMECEFIDGMNAKWLWIFLGLFKCENDKFRYVKT
jgi:hypothetical protein